ncbi:hypothetical protein [Muribaculum intestinale]|uniref:hypothetical protein n=1 Tax=Muribaculum intestinale TaxID=1796646 RepID=UPI0025AA262E|nr:hypothetical protein [Muribaculum intestinale]
MASKFKEQRFATKKKADKRIENSRNEKAVEGDLPKVVFSLKDFDRSQIPPGQTFEDWEKFGHLSYLMQKLEYISQKNIVEAINEGYIKVYGSFPPNSDFTHPSHIASDVNWAVIMKINGQKGRVAGHIINNVFYIVFLDIEHLFYKMKKRK